MFRGPALYVRAYLRSGFLIIGQRPTLWHSGRELRTFGSSPSTDLRRLERSFSARQTEFGKGKAQNAPLQRKEFPSAP